ncbi:SdrD B-like domain-containing protein [Luteimicrobium subarcticum]|uniref:SdrD B-like protein n=1 Tax=Luteimicrobium subarcticum TaxID=620910 RepID=A0A2M8WJM4_9MICO|nr:SdrD B-like domain-containing protein [Luteimicrobium subarcticum]PJI91123.1 SdrD B-like protein [Luteimicrobium subarcticum]
MGVRGARGGIALVGAFVTALVVATSGTPALAVDGSVSGTVFQDFDSNGVLDTAGGAGVPVDRGVAGVLVTAVDREGATVGTARSAADGTYSVAVTGADSADVRLQFSDLPDGYEPSYSVLGAGAGESGSDVQLAQVGDTGLDFGINAPDDYSSAGVDTPVVTAIHYSGDRTEQQVANQPAIVAYPWQTGATSPGSAPAFNGSDLAESRTTLATVSQVGGVWGLATQRSTGDVFASAVLKRQVDLGPLGLGGIYVVPRVMDPSTGEIGTPGAARPYFDLDGQGDVDLNPDGVDLSTAGRELGAFNVTAADGDVYDTAGTIGLGGMALSSDGNTLYVMNLTQKRLELVDVSGVVPQYIGSQDLNLGPDDRPWAVSVLHGTVYVGYVQDASAGDQPPPADGAVDDDEWFVSDSHAVVRSAPESDLGALGSASSQVLDTPLDFQRGLVWGVACGTAGEADQRTLRFCHWHPWTQAQGDGTYQFGANLMGISDPGTAGIGWAQPLVSSIELTADGDVAIGMQDRFSLQAGNYDVGPDGTNSSTEHGFEGYSQGDTLLAAKAADGTLTLESDGAAGGVTGASPGNVEGPGGGEFLDDSNVFADPAEQVHHENTTGALTRLPGVDELLSTAFDPAVDFRTNGFSWFDTSAGSGTTGESQRARVVQDQDLAGALQKAGGLGDVSTLLPLAPLQIGNVVWFDADQDGVQDADEPPLPGVTVNLLDADGNQIATTTTDANGQYYFATDDPDIDGFDPDGGDYTVQFVKPTSGDAFDDDSTFGTVPWTDVSFTAQDAGTNDSVDSDADPTTGEVPYTAGDPGENDPTIDAGFVADVDTTVTKVVDDAGLWVDPDATYTITVDARDFRGDPLPSTTLTLGDGDTADAPVAPDTWPAGTQVRVTEDADPSFDTTVDPDGWTLVSDGTPEGGFTVTNTRVASTGFEILKDVEDSGGLVPDGTTYTGTWQCTYPDASTVVGSGAWELTGGGTTTVASDLPVGATCTVTEDPPAVVDDGAWQDPDISGTVTLGPGDDTVPVVTVTNTFTPDTPTPTPTPSTATPTVSPTTSPTTTGPTTAAPVPSPTGTTPSDLAVTGADVRRPLLAVLALLVLGGAFVLVARRRT